MQKVRVFFYGTSFNLFKFGTFEYEDDAWAVIEVMQDLIDEYGVVSQRDVYSKLDMDYSHIDNKWGWTSLRNAGVYPVRVSGERKYMLDLPPAKPI